MMSVSEGISVEDALSQLYDYFTINAQHNRDDQLFVLLLFQRTKGNLHNLIHILDRKELHGLTNL